MRESLASIPPGRANRSVRRYLLDPRFQLKYTAYLVVVVVAVMAGLGVVIYGIASESTAHARVAVEQAEKALKESQVASHVLQMQSISAAGDDEGLAKMLEEELAKKDKEYEQNLDEVKREKGEVDRGERRVFVWLVGSAAALVGLLVVMGIFITHRIVGPIFKMKRLLRKVATGRFDVKERLRKGDELSDLFDTFLQMTLSLKVRQLDRSATLEEAIDAAEKGGGSPELLEKLRALKAQLQLF